MSNSHSFFATTAYTCQCFFFPLAVFPFHSFSRKSSLWNPRNSFFPCSLVWKVIPSSLIQPSCIPKKWPENRPSGRIEVVIFFHKTSKCLGEQKGRHQLAFTKSHLGSLISSNEDKVVLRFGRYFVPAARVSLMACGSLSMASTFQPRRSNSTVSRPAPQPRSIANRCFVRSVSASNSQSARLKVGVGGLFTVSL